MTSIAHISDLHFGALDAPVAEALVPYLQSLRPDLLAVSGDLTQRARSLQFHDAMRWLARFDAPKLIVPGNHDIPMDALWERLANPLGRFRQNVTADLSPTWASTDLSVLGINSARRWVPVLGGFWKDGKVTDSQLRAAVHRAASDDTRCRIIVMHHPLLPSPGTTGGTVLLCPGVLQRMAASGIHVVLGGHLHACYSGLLHIPTPAGDRTLLSVQAGTATSSRRRHAPDGSEYPNAFNLLRFSQQALSIEIHEFVNNAWRHGKSANFRRKSGGFAECEPSPSTRPERNP